MKSQRGTLKVYLIWFGSKIFSHAWLVNWNPVGLETGVQMQSCHSRDTAGCSCPHPVGCTCSLPSYHKTAGAHDHSCQRASSAATCRRHSVCGNSLKIAIIGALKHTKYNPPPNISPSPICNPIYFSCTWSALRLLWHRYDSIATRENSSVLESSNFCSSHCKYVSSVTTVSSMNRPSIPDISYKPTWYKPKYKSLSRFQVSLAI